MKSKVVASYKHARMAFDETNDGEIYRPTGGHGCIAIMNAGFESPNVLRVVWFYPEHKEVGSITRANAKSLMVMEFLPGEQLIHEFE